MPRFDLYRNPNPHASHALYLDVQSDLVSTATRWCLPLLAVRAGSVVMSRAQALIEVQGGTYVADTPNILAVPAKLLRQPLGRLAAGAQPQIEAMVEFMLRG